MSPGGNVFRDKVMILLDLDLGASDWSALSAIAVLKGQAEIQLKTAETLGAGCGAEENLPSGYRTCVLDPGHDGNHTDGYYTWVQNIVLA